MDAAPPFSEAYFVVLFSALPVLALETLPFANSGMGRELVAMQVEVVPGKSLFIGTSHLESMPQFSRTRVAQLKEAMRFLEERVEKSSNNTTCLGAIFMGDMNLMRADLKLLDARLGRAVAALDVEKAKSARSKCRKCGETIAKDALRVGKMAKDTLPGGKHLEIRLWYHEACFVGIATPEEKLVLQSLGASTGASNSAAASAADVNTKFDLATLGLPAGWKDLWLSVEGNTEENGYTFDGKVNALVSSKAFQSRLDRMYFYAGPTPLREAFEASSSAVLDSMQIVGKEPISDGLWPSDHFGLLASFKFDEDDRTTKASEELKRDSEAASPPKKKARETLAANAGRSADTAVEVD